MPNIQFQVRRGTSLTWTSTNPTLANGEFGFETDTRQLKIGNGTAWNSLPHIEIGQAANWSTFRAYQTVDISANTLNNVGSIRNGAGTASAPSYSFTADTAVGMYDAGANILGFATSGVERMRMDANGNVGINTTPSNIHLLQIRRDEPFSNRAITTIPSQLCIESTGFRLKLGAFWTSGQGGAATIQAADFFSSQDNPATLLINPLGGNVGIGTSAPRALLDVAGPIYGRLPVFEVSSTTQTLTVGTNDNAYFYIRNSGFSNIVTPASTTTAQGGMFWTFKNATSSFLSVTLANTLSLTSPITISPSNAITLTVSPTTANTLLLF